MTLRRSRSDDTPKLGRYVIHSLIGKGSMGVVYRALDTRLNRTVAVKTIRQELIAREHDYEMYRSRFYQEASIFGSLSHPNIVALYDVGEPEVGAPFLAMEYIQGDSLVGPHHGKQRSVEQIRWILTQVANAIDYAHGQNIIHRDIKPSNILVGENDEAKIVDFGVAKALGSHFTKSQTVFGTPGYMSPEQVLGGTLTNRTDIFSLGVVAFELLSGERPFPAQQVHSLLYQLVHCDPILPAHLSEAGLDTKKWQEVFARALAKEPAERFSTASELVTALAEVLPGAWLGHLVSGFPSHAVRAREDSESPQTLTLWKSRDATLVTSVKT